jgi:putative ABC transport system substrate-binding protein
MRRREFIGLVGGAAAVTWPLAVRAQQPDRIRRVGVLVPGANNDPDQQLRLRVFQDALREFGWTDGRNLQIDIRYAAGNVEQFQIYAAELLALRPDVLIADATPSTSALQHATRAVPIVFARVTDPVGQGFVGSMAQPGTNITGFTNYEDAMGSKWIDLLKDAVPSITRVALIYNPQTAPYTPSFLPAFEIAARKRGMTLSNAPVHDASEIGALIAIQGREPGGGLILQTDSFLVVHRDLIAASAARYLLPTIGAIRLFAASGCLMSYGVETSSMYRGAATYVDRILKGAKPADLPVQGPTKYELVINLKTATVLGIAVPQSMLVGADEVIE